MDQQEKLEVAKQAIKEAVKNPCEILDRRMGVVADDAPKILARSSAGRIVIDETGPLLRKAIELKKFAAAVAGILMLAGACAAHAGVVVDEQQVVDPGNGKPVTRSMVEMVQGNKRKTITTGKQATVIDLDSGTMTMMSIEHKAYVQMPLSPKGSLPSSAPTMKFQKTGDHETIAGYSCDDYTAAGSLEGNESKITGCFSTSAPGASEFSAFNKAMAERVKGTPMSLMGEFPAGVPLKIDVTTKITHVSMPGKSPPEQVAKLKQLLAKRPPVVTHITVTKITSQSLPTDTFTPPADYAKQEMPQQMRGPDSRSSRHGRRRSAGNGAEIPFSTGFLNL